jgi:hypothetical protein
MSSSSVITPIKNISISGSQIDKYNLCGKAHEYAYTMELTPAPGFVNLAKFRGTMGHAALAVYYKALMEDVSSAEARVLALDFLRSEARKVDKNIPNFFEVINVILSLIPMLERYFDHYVTEPFKVISVETEYSTSLDGDIEYLAILDLVVEWLVGEWRGEFVVVDHKFVHDFKSEAQLKMDGQQPKYIKVARANGFRAKRAIFNQIRTRSLKNPKHQDLFRRSPLKSTLAEVNAIWNEHRDAALEIVYDRKKPRRIMNEYICKGCEFRDLCHLELVTSDSSDFIRANFVKKERPKKDEVSE